MKKTDIYFFDLVNLMSILRSRKGCPWDRKQTHRSLKTCLIEETCEVLDSINKRNPGKLMEELGVYFIRLFFTPRLPRRIINSL